MLEIYEIISFIVGFFRWSYRSINVTVIILVDFLIRVLMVVVVLWIFIFFVVCVFWSLDFLLFIILFLKKGSFWLVFYYFEEYGV